jgi:hypothetical protein
MTKIGISILTTAMVVMVLGSTAAAQTTAFTYQGRLTDNMASATGTYDMQFALFDAQTGGAQIGTTQTDAAVGVASGIFTVQLDFGAAAFPGAERYLQIWVRRNSSESYQALTPRQRITSTPYAIRALEATNVGGVPATGFIRNSASQQTGANFYIDGNGTAGGTLSANIVNAQTQYDIAGNRVLTMDGVQNLFIGLYTGVNNTSGYRNSFVGAWSGVSNTEGNDNSFFGPYTGERNTQGSENVFIGTDAGRMNTVGMGNTYLGVRAGKNSTGSFNVFIGDRTGFLSASGDYNSFVGADSGQGNRSGAYNSFVGYRAGYNNTDGNFNTFLGTFAGHSNWGSNNSFIGSSAGLANSTGNFNSFLGHEAGDSNVSGSQNTIVGSFADMETSGLTNATAIGSRAFVSQSNTLILGSISGANGATATVSVGIGTNQPQQRLSVSDGLNIDQNNLFGGGNLSSSGTNNALIFGSGSGEGIASKRTSGGNQYGLDFYSNYISRMSISNSGVVSIYNLGAAGGTPLCRNASNQIAACSSLAGYSSGDIQKRIDDQDETIRRQQDQIELLRKQLDGLKKLLCLQNTPADVCKEN